MKESKIKKLRYCDKCRRDIYGDAKKFKEHHHFHAVATRTGLYLPEFSIDQPRRIEVSNHA